MEDQETRQPVATDEKRFITLKQAAIMLDVSDRTVRRLVASGELPQLVKVRGSTKLAARDIEDYVDRLISARDRGCP